MVSVIIPVYNTGEYLTPCVKSICNQTYRDLQIVIVDDGSEILTAELCDKLAAEDKRIVVIHKQNEGVSVARNTGLNIATGEIICFVDSDDTIQPRMIETLVDALEQNNAQIAMCDAVTIRTGHPNEPDTIPDYEQSCVIETNAISSATLTRLAGSAWRCAYRRTDTLLAAQARFPEGVKFSEDRIFNIIAMSAANRIAYIKQPFYNRLIRQGSACNRYYPDMTEQIVKMRSVLISAVRQYWGEKHVAAYEKQITGQIKFAVTNFTSFHNGETWCTNISKLKSLCDSQKIRECIIASQSNDIRSRMILNKQYILLYCLGRMTNLHHRICKRGQYQA